MFRIAFVTLFLSAIAATAQPTPLPPTNTYATACENAIKNGTPLCVLVGFNGSDYGQLEKKCPCCFVQSLTGFKTGDIVTCFPSGGKLYWVATYTRIADVVVPTAATCTGPTCSGVNTVSSCSSCGSATGFSTTTRGLFRTRTVTNTRTVTTSSGGCANGQCGR